MARKFYKYPPRPSSGSGTFSDNLVGNQITGGGGLTQGNFDFTTKVVESSKRNFITGVFSEPITLDELQILNTIELKEILSKELLVYPNFDLSEVTKFTLFGSLKKRISVSITNILNYFPAGIQINNINPDLTISDTATDIVYNVDEDITTFKLDVNKFKNPFNIDYTINSARNISLRETNQSPLRDFSKYYFDYVAEIDGLTYPIISHIPSKSLYDDVITITVQGKPFTGITSTDTIVIRPNDSVVDVSFMEYYDEVERFLLNRKSSPIYTAKFNYPEILDNGTPVQINKVLTWPLDGIWNLDIVGDEFDQYLLNLYEICEEFDSYTTNLITRFMVTDSLLEFDTSDQRVNKILNIYGRNFDEVKKFADSLAHMTSVNYVVKNDIPSALLKNLAQTLGWNTNISLISEDDFLNSIFGLNKTSEFDGMSNSDTPAELNYQFYRNLILNSSYLFRSKGTRKSIEGLLRLVGAPDALIEFNEYVYTTNGRLNMSIFSNKFNGISAGTYVNETVQLDRTNVYKFQGIEYTGYTSAIEFVSVDTTRSDYPVDEDGYPSKIQNSDDFFFQKGAGWFELNKGHQSLEEIDLENSVFTGNNLSVQTKFEGFTYGDKYLSRYRRFPYMDNLGFDIVKNIDNKKSWLISDNNRKYSNAGINSHYTVDDDRNVINVKNIELHLSPAKGLLYDVWDMSRKYGYPIPYSGLTNLSGDLDKTNINPSPNKMSFFEFSQTFIKNLINVKNRQFSSDGKTSGYPTLQSLYWKYLNSGKAINVPNNNFTYDTMIKYLEGIGDYWIRLVEQMIPSSTLFEGGNRFENSIFHRQKHVYRIQRGCQLLPLPCDPCEINTSIFKYDCITEKLECSLFPFGGNINNFKDVLYQTIINYLNNNGLTLNQCQINTLVSDWYVDLRVGNDVLVKYKFFTGYGLLDAPSENEWINAVDSSMTNIYEQGFDYDIEEDVLILTSIGCTPKNRNKQVQLNVGLDFSISCS